MEDLICPPSDTGSSTEISNKGRMGDAYIKAKKLSPTEVDAIVHLQSELHIRFGEAAVKLGLLTEEDVREVLDIQFDYASFAANGGAARISSSLAIVHAPASEAAEAVRRLRSELLVRLGQESSASLAVLSPTRREGKSHIAASLAIAFAQLNIKTMLIDGNLRDPIQHRLFSLSNQSGLSTILAQRSSNSLDAIPEVIPNFWVLGSGPLPPNPLEILSAPRFRALLDHFAKQVAVFIVDTPSAMQFADAQMIARQTTCAMLVARENLTKLTDLKKSKNEMEDTGIEILGTVYNQPPKSADSEGHGWRASMLSPFSRTWGRLTRTPKGGA